MKKAVIVGSIIICFVLSLMWMGFNEPAKSDEKGKDFDVVKINETFFPDADLHELDRMSYKTAVMYKGKKLHTLPTFNNRSEALKNLIKTKGSTLKYMQEKYDLKELSAENWEAYKGQAMALSHEVLEGALNKDADYIARFFDIYENDDENAEIIQEINDAKNESGEVIDKDELIKSLNDLMPMDAEIK